MDDLFSKLPQLLLPIALSLFGEDHKSGQNGTPRQSRVARLASRLRPWDSSLPKLLTVRHAFTTNNNTLRAEAEAILLGKATSASHAHDVLLPVLVEVLGWSTASALRRINNAVEDARRFALRDSSPNDPQTLMACILVHKMKHDLLSQVQQYLSGKYFFSRTNRVARIQAMHACFEEHLDDVVVGVQSYFDLKLAKSDRIPKHCPVCRYFGRYLYEFFDGAGTLRVQRTVAHLTRDIIDKYISKGATRALTVQRAVLGMRDHLLTAVEDKLDKPYVELAG